MTDKGDCLNICGISYEKNGINGMCPGIVSMYGGQQILDLKGFKNLLVADLKYFVEHHEDILKRVKEQIKLRDSKQD